MIIFLLSGLLLKVDLGIATIALLGFMAGGMFLGMKLHKRMKPERVGQVVHLLLVLSGSSLAIRALLMTAI